MQNSDHTQTLYGRVIHRYFGFGLAGICLLLIPVVLFRREGGNLQAWTALAAFAAPLAVLWAGAFELRRLLSAPQQILTQLAGLSDRPSVRDQSLLPIPESDPTAAGWNLLLQQMNSGSISSELEKKLSAALQSGQDARAQ
ncbi:MAG: hypothetical protein KDA89_20405, partial [Planctomycetaceae bacterium]|nr:hypothetical protein [Planctomycetaceae bacterium]